MPLSTTTKIWLKGMLAATINAGATAVSAVLFGAQFSVAWKMVVFQAGMGAANYLKTSPMPISSVVVEKTEKTQVDVTNKNA